VVQPPARQPPTTPESAQDDRAGEKDATLAELILGKRYSLTTARVTGLAGRDIEPRRRWQSGAPPGDRALPLNLAAASRVPAISLSSARPGS
jgi:hypothetical protein